MRKKKLYTAMNLGRRFGAGEKVLDILKLFLKLHQQHFITADLMGGSENVVFADELTDGRSYMTFLR